MTNFAPSRFPHPVLLRIFPFSANPLILRVEWSRKSSESEFLIFVQRAGGRGSALCPRQKMKRGGRWVAVGWEPFSGHAEIIPTTEQCAADAACCVLLLPDSK